MYAARAGCGSASVGGVVVQLYEFGSISEE
jgi:hypothetical protein